MIAEFLQIQTSLNFLPMLDRELISRDETSLIAMSTTSVSLYLYGARKLADQQAMKIDNKGCSLYGTASNLAREVQRNQIIH
jgi:hypothetical protein